MKGRLILAVITTMLDELLVIVLLIWGLPKLGVKLPLFVLVLIGVLWTCFAVVMYVAGSKILGKKPVSGLTDMVGFKGVVTTALIPQGLVKINGELWTARSVTSNIEQGSRIEVESQKGLILIVHQIN